MDRNRVILPEGLVAAIDNRFGACGRSRFVEEAVREKLERLELEEALVSVAGVLSEQDYPEFADQTSINEWVRAERRG